MLKADDVLFWVEFASVEIWAVMILDFHHTIMMALRIHTNDIFAISMEKKSSVDSSFYSVSPDFVGK